VNYLVFLTLYEKTRLLGNWRPDHCGETNGLVSFFIERLLWKNWILERNSWYRFSDEQNSRMDSK